MYLLHKYHISLSLPSVPHQASIYIAPRDGQEMVSWSLDSFIPPPSPCGGGKECYFVLFTRGTGEAESSFWIEIQVKFLLQVKLVDPCTLPHYVKMPVKGIIGSLLSCFPCLPPSHCRVTPVHKSLLTSP